MDLLKTHICKGCTIHTFSMYFKETPERQTTRLLPVLHANEVKQIVFSCWSISSRTVIIVKQNYNQQPPHSDKIRSKRTRTTSF